jgi:hypothetical protein
VGEQVTGRYGLKALIGDVPRVVRSQPAATDVLA